MHKAWVSVDRTYEEIRKATSPADKTRLSVNLSSCMSELRKAQEAFQKAYKRRIEEITILQQQKLSSKTGNPDPATEDLNIDEIVQQIRNEDSDTELLHDDPDYNYTLQCSPGRKRVTAVGLTQVYQTTNTKTFNHCPKLKCSQTLPFMLP